MAGISSKALKPNYAENKYKFNNGNELQGKEFSDGSELGLYDATFRMYDPQIGRFHQLDPLSDLFDGYSPYVFALNNPILMNDPIGLAADTAVPGVPLMPAVVVTPNNPQLNPTQVNCPTCGQSTPEPVVESPSSGDLAYFILTRENFIRGSTNRLDPEEFFMLSMQLRESNVYEKILRTVVVERKWYEFWQPLGYKGKNALGEDVVDPIYGGFGPPVSIGRFGNAATYFRAITATRKSIPNFFIGINLVRFENALAKAAGTAWRLTKDGRVKELIHNGVRYVSRTHSASGQNTVEIWKDGVLLMKYRLM